MRDGQTDEVRQCNNGHVMPNDFRYCPECGSPISGPGSRSGGSTRRLLLGVLGAAMALALVGAALMLAQSGDKGNEVVDDASASSSSGASTPTTAALSLMQACEVEMGQALAALVGDIAAGYTSMSGPGATELGAEYGLASPFVLEAAKVLWKPMNAYYQGGAEAAAAEVPGAAKEACQVVVGAEATAEPEGSSEEVALEDSEAAADLAQPTAGEPDPDCTLGASACMFYNGIQGDALVDDIAADFSVRASDVNCDLSDVRYDNVAAGDTFYCSTDASGYPTVAVLVTETDPFYVVSAAPISGD